MKKIVKVLLLTEFILLLFISCNQTIYELNKDSQSKETVPSETGQIILGDVIENPFSLRNSKSRAVYGENIEANYLYYRVRVQDDEEALNFLYENFGALEYVPMDKEIVQSGFYYIDDELSPEQWPWFYFMTDLESYKFITESPYQFEVEILDSLYMAQDVYDALENGDTEALSETLLGRVYSDELENSDEARYVTHKFFKIKWHTAKPSGTVTFQDVLNNFKDTPLRNVTVKTWQLPLINSSTKTNKEGKFNINHTYSDLLGMKVNLKIVYENEHCELNGHNMNWDELNFFTGIAAVAQYIVPAYYSTGSHSVAGGIENMEIKLEESTSNTMQRANDLANILNAVEDYHDFCLKYHITEPVKCNMLFLNGSKTFKGACTLMGSYTASDELEGLGMILGEAFSGVFGAIGGILIGDIFSRQIPDIIFCMDSVTESFIDEIFHELGHASHFSAVGQSYWQKEHKTMLDYWVSNIKDAKKYCYPLDNSLVDYIESWGYLTGPYVLNWKLKKFGKSANLSMLGKKHLAKKNERIDNCSFYASGYYDLIDNNINISDFDYIKPGMFTITDIFDVYKDKSVKSIDSFIEKFSKNKNLSSEDISNVKKTIYGANYEE